MSKKNGRRHFTPPQPKRPAGPVDGSIRVGSHSGRVVIDLPVPSSRVLLERADAIALARALTKHADAPVDATISNQPQRSDAP
jgi:hypothetical protein